jgi:hypothetical protein
MKILDASEPKFGGPMTEDEVRDFLVNSNKNVHISTLDEKGEPNIHPTWYYFDNSNDKLYIESGEAEKNLRKLEILEIIISYTIALMKTTSLTKESLAREQ